MAYLKRIPQVAWNKLPMATQQEFASCSDRTLALGWLILACASIFLAFWIQRTTSWIDFQDGAIYRQSAANLLSGSPYNAMPLVVGPTFVYPPGYPVIIALLWTVFGRNLIVLKIANVVFLFLAFIPASRLLLGLTRSKTISLFVCFLWLASPIFIATKEFTGSDLAFICATYWFLYLVEMFLNRTSCDGAPKWPYLYLTLLGIFLAGAIEIRSAGAAIVPAILVYETYKNRSVPYNCMIICIVAGIFVLLSPHLFPRPSSDYLAVYSHGTVEDLIRERIGNINRYRWALATNLDPWFGHSLGDVLGTVLATATILLAALGVSWVAFSSWNLITIFCLAYFGVILVFPDAGGTAWQRYLLPIFPVIFALACRGLQLLFRRYTAMAQVAVWIFLGGIGLSFALSFVQSPLSRRVAIGYPTRSSEEMMEFLREKTGPTDVIAFFVPRAIAAEVRRRATPLLTEENWSKLGMTPKDGICYYEKRGVTYIVAKQSRQKFVTRSYRWDYSDEDFISRIVRRFPDVFAEKFHNSDYRIYRFSPASIPCSSGGFG
jgi:hypothetical protein